MITVNVVQTVHKGENNESGSHGAPSAAANDKKQLPMERDGSPAIWAHERHQRASTKACTQECQMGEDRLGLRKKAGIGRQRGAARLPRRDRPYFLC